MTPIAALRDSDIVFVLFGKLFDDLPGPVLASVIDEKYTAVFTDLVLRCQRIDLRQKFPTGDRQHFFLVVTRYHNI